LWLTNKRGGRKRKEEQEQKVHIETPAGAKQRVGGLCRGDGVPSVAEHPRWRLLYQGGQGNRGVIIYTTAAHLTLTVPAFTENKKGRR